MKILHISPFNTAGLPLTLVEAEKELGYNSRLVTFAKHKYGYEEDLCLNLPFMELKIINYFKPSSNSLAKNTTYKKRKYSPTKTKLLMIREMLWKKKVDKFLQDIDIESFDIIQLDGGIEFYIDARIIKKFIQNDKKIICVYYGSDLRTRGVDDTIDNLSHCNFTFEYDHLDLYNNLNILPFPFRIKPHLLPKKIDKDKNKIIIGHAPSNRNLKGTDFILAELNKLKTKYNFELLLIENKPYAEALKLKSLCTIFIDQVSDIGYGINSLEALKLGIPAFSSLTEKFKSMCTDNPIIEINFNNFSSEIEKYINEPSIYNDKIKHGIDWVDTFHDPKNVVKQIIKISNI